MVAVKICGITRVEDARAAIELGADMLGLNFVPSSKRFVKPSVARDLKRQLQSEPNGQTAGRSPIRWVGVVADLPASQLASLRAESEMDCLQWHGHESPELIAAQHEAGHHDFKAVRVSNAEDAVAAARFPGDWLLADAASPTGELGGSGHTFDWELVKDLAAQRRLILAGGLNPSNVAEAVRQIRPFAVDVASGVEVSPGVKEAAKIARFVEQARCVE